MARVMIRDCSVLLVPDAGECGVAERQDILIENGVITGVVPTGTTTEALGGADPTGGTARTGAEGATGAAGVAGHVEAGAWEVIDATGLLAVPGLTNAHTHSPMVMMRGAAEDVSIDDWFNRRIWPMEVNLTPERVQVGARLACAEMLLGGTTTFVDHYFHADRIAAAALECGIRADIAPTFFSSTGDAGREAAFDAARAVRESDRAGRGHGHPRVTASLGPHATYTVTEDDLARTVRVAGDEGFRIHLHAAETEEQTRASVERLGATPVEVLERTGVLGEDVLVAHGCGITEADLPLLARHSASTAVACCPKVYLKLAMGPTTPVKALWEAGVAVGVGTDGAAVHNTLDVWESLRLLALTQKQREGDAEWMTLSQTLRLATRGGAAAAGLAGVTGAIEPGLRADVVLVDLSGPHHQPVHDPMAALVYSTRASDVITVLVDGEVVVRDRCPTKVDLAETVAHARALARELVDLSAGGAVQRYDP
ncbi:amidohydrolase [Streptomyces sp. NPDC050504]|uniref:amidohydrolase n=1 Tax=Streptomyces sp. NPDC050504 TaxID=3365618 RepID=UPI003788D207